MEDPVESQLTVQSPARPEPASFVWPSLSLTVFPAFISRWISLIKCSELRPFKVDLKMKTISSSLSPVRDTQEVFFQ